MDALLITVEDVDRWAAFAKNHPLAASALLGSLVTAASLLLFLLFVGTLASHIDDTKLKSRRLAAAVRLGRKWGCTLSESGPDLAILLLGEKYARNKEQEEGTDQEDT